MRRQDQGMRPKRQNARRTTYGGDGIKGGKGKVGTTLLDICFKEQSCLRYILT